MSSTNHPGKIVRYISSFSDIIAYTLSINSELQSQYGCIPIGTNNPIGVFVTPHDLDQCLRYIKCVGILNTYKQQLKDIFLDPDIDICIPVIFIDPVWDRSSTDTLIPLLTEVIKLFTD